MTQLSKTSYFDLSVKSFSSYSNLKPGRLFWDTLYIIENEQKDTGASINHKFDVTSGATLWCIAVQGES